MFCVDFWEGFALDMAEKSQRKGELYVFTGAARLQ